MALSDPYSLVVTSNGEDIVAQWVNGDSYGSIDIQYHTGGAWTDTAAAGHATSRTLLAVTVNTLYTVRVRGRVSFPVPEVSGWTTEETATSHSDTLTDTLTFTDSLTDAAASDIFQDTLTFSDVLSEIGTYVDTFTDTLTFSDFLLDAQTLRTDFAYYLIDSSGNVYQHGEDYLGDAGASISSTFETKNTDFADQDMQVKDEFKEVFGARLHYKDLSSDAVVSVSYSTDGGIIWYPTTQTLGTGDETVKSVDFFFRATAHSFQFKVEHASADKDFQWSGLEIFYLPAGEFFSIE